MTLPRKPEQNQIGATIPDLLLKIFASPYLVIPLFLLIVAFLASIGLGFIDLSWGDNGLKLSQGHRGSEAPEANITGHWKATGKDLSDSDHKLVAKYTYVMRMRFTQTGSNVELTGSYRIQEDGKLPERHISGKGVIHGDYLSLMYDIEVEDPPAKTHGTMMIQIQPSSQGANGYYVTRSMANNGFVFGSIDLSRD